MVKYPANLKLPVEHEVCLTNFVEGRVDDQKDIPVVYKSCIFVNLILVPADTVIKSQGNLT